jgi:predicted ATPase
MLTRLTIQGFKSLQNVQNLELGLINVFIGANGSGKSNLLEGIGFLSAIADDQLDDQALLRRGVRLTIPRLFRSSFERIKPPTKTCIHITWKLEENSVEYQVKLDDSEDTQDQSWPLEVESKFNGKNMSQGLYGWILDEADIAIINIWQNLSSTLSDYGVFSPNTPTLRGMAIDHTQRQPVGLAGGRLAEAIDELLALKPGYFGPLELDELKELLDWVDEIAIVPPSRELVSASVPTLRNIIRFTDRWMDETRNQISAYDASEGALYVLFALVLALHPKSPRLFAIDNFDQAMHPRLARATTRLFCQQMLRTDPLRQALLTTHNPLVLDGLDLRDDRIRLFAVERNAKGATQVYRVKVSDQILQETQSGLPLSSLWVMGRLGGVPDLF